MFASSLRSFPAVALVLTACVSTACVSTARVSTARPHAGSAVGDTQLAQGEAAHLAPADFHGVWAEYWALEGVADTQRYVFTEDGRFGWLAPARTTPPMDPVQRSGTFRVETRQGRPFLVLEVARERFAACQGGCANAGEARVVTHAAPLVLQYEVDECPPNDEAQVLDGAYVCRSVGGQAFWRRANAASIDTAAFFE
jgi:hypothetical protein